MSYRFKSEGVEEIMKAVGELGDKAMFMISHLMGV